MPKYECRDSPVVLKQPMAVLHGHGDWVRSAKFSPDGSLLLTCGHDQTARLWSVASHDCLAVIPHSFSLGTVADASWSPDGSLVATVSRFDGGKARLWLVEFDSSAPKSTSVTLAGILGVGDDNTRPRHNDVLYGVSFSPDGRRIATASRDCTACLWSAQTRECLGSLRGHSYTVNTARFSSDGDYLVTGSSDHTARIWSVEAHDCVAVLRGHENGVSSASFSPDGSLIVTTGFDGTVRLWNRISAGSCVLLLPCSSKTVWSAEFSSNGTHLATAHEEELARIWKVVTGQCLVELHDQKHHRQRVFAASFSDDGKLMATAGTEGTVVLWEIPWAAETTTMEEDEEPEKC